MKKINWTNNKYLTLSIITAIIAFFLFSFFNDKFFLWAFARHQNILSWIIRPLLLLPFCFFSYKRNLNGILLTVLAIFTSMFWFPTPSNINPQVAEFLEAEIIYLTSGFDLMKVFSIVLIVAFFYFLSVAFWKRSIKRGIWIAVIGAVLKIIWSINESSAGYKIIPFALLGIVVLILSIWLYKKFLTNKKYKTKHK